MYLCLMTLAPETVEYVRLSIFARLAWLRSNVSIANHSLASFVAVIVLFVMRTYSA